MKSGLNHFIFLRVKSIDRSNRCGRSSHGGFPGREFPWRKASVVDGSRRRIGLAQKHERLFGSAGKKHGAQLSTTTTVSVSWFGRYVTHESKCKPIDKHTSTTSCQATEATEAQQLTSIIDRIAVAQFRRRLQVGGQQNERIPTVVRLCQDADAASRSIDGCRCPSELR